MTPPPPLVRPEAMGDVSRWSNCEHRQPKTPYQVNLKQDMASSGNTVASLPWIACAGTSSHCTRLTQPGDR